ncbi:probable 3',5'-cyclic phosphodiesterase pde-5 [Centruroides sculpturatus]|uniref:probable 3',5'-cyclic phosphodiesterase pde-5 n=1 Tax=Centruroides sculpturatus TaxID=218467 RepID=UPI000C6CB8AB|nr:probable 3',5'-cyclic phosphodiesterase pde-5 [Centruroides sculpturatus]
MYSQRRKSWIKDPIHDISNWLTMNPGVKNKNLDETIMEYLHLHPDLVEQFVLENVTVKTVKKWIRNKSEEYNSEANRCDLSTPFDLSEDMLELVKLGETKKLLLKFTLVLQEAVKADDVQVDLNKVEISEREVNPNVKIEKYKNKKIIKLRFCSSYPYHNCIIVLRRLGNSLPFSLIDEDVTLFLSNCLATCFFLYESKCEDVRDQVLRELFPQIRALLMDVDMTRNVATKILSKTRHLLSADRIHLFVFDDKRDELIAEYFDSGIDFVISDLRCSLNEGCCSLTANKGKPVSISNNADNEKMFNEIKATNGIDVNNLICCPVKCDGNLLGMLQVLKGCSSPFSATDEAIAECMSIYCSLVLYVAKTHTHILVKENKIAVNKEMLKYHIQPSREDLESLVQDPYLKISPPDIESIDFAFTNYAEQDIPKLFIHIARNILGDQLYPLDKLSNFILTVIESYRDVAYHNIFHAFNVTHCIYLMTKDAKDKFSVLEIKAFLVACICHDSDHRGFNNNFLIITNSPLASLYVNSIMERHHYQMALNILQDEENDVFCDLSKEARQEVLNDIETCILATDLAVFRSNKDNLQYLIDNGEFDIDNDAHRKCLKKVMMNGCDVSAVCKPWPVQLEIVKDLYREMYAQGDIEKEMGMKPDSLMDRDLQERIPEDQINFINYICLPCYELVANCLPQTKFILAACKETIKNWKETYPFQEPIKI